MATTLRLTDCVADKVAIVAKMGPAQGAQTKPNEKPVTKPAPNPVPSFLNFDCKGPNKLLIKTSNLAPKEGINIDKPKSPMMIVATRRKAFGLMGNILTM